jgi:hypothetical protein
MVAVRRPLRELAFRSRERGYTDEDPGTDPSGSPIVCWLPVVGKRGALPPVCVLSFHFASIPHSIRAALLFPSPLRVGGKAGTREGS